MRLSPELNEALNQQVLHEYRNQLLYTQIGCFFENRQLKGLSAYFRTQAQHEKEHGDKFLNHINSRTGGKAVIEAIIAPPGLGEVDNDNMVEIGNAYVSAEESTTTSIESIYELALDIKSYIDLPFLAEMLSEQVEEEDSATEFALNIKTTKDLVLFDKSFGQIV